MFVFILVYLFLYLCISLFHLCIYLSLFLEWNFIPMGCSKFVKLVHLFRIQNLISIFFSFLQKLAVAGFQMRPVSRRIQHSQIQKSTLHHRPHQKVCVVLERVHDIGHAIKESWGGNSILRFQALSEYSRSSCTN